MRADFHTEDDDVIRSTLQKADVDPAAIGLELANKSKVGAKGATGSSWAV